MLQDDSHLYRTYDIKRKGKVQNILDNQFSMTNGPHDAGDKSFTVYYLHVINQPHLAIESFISNDIFHINCQIENCITTDK